MTVFMGNPNASRRVRKEAPQKVPAPAGEIEGEGPGWKEVEPPAKRKAGKAAPVIFKEEPAPVDAEPVPAPKAKAKAKAKAKPADDQPTDKKPKAKAKAEPKAKPKAKAKAEPKAKKAEKAKAPVEVKPEKVKAPKRSKGRRPPPLPVEGKVTKILLRLTAQDVHDIDTHRGDLTRPAFIHHLARTGVHSKGRRITD